MRRLALALVFAFLQACTTSPLTGRGQYLLVSDSMAVSQSAAAYSQMMADLGKKKKVESGTPRASVTPRTPRYSRTAAYTNAPVR